MWCAHLCDTPSNFRSQGNLGDLLEKWNIPGVCGVDTRRITRILREQGVMNACICDAVPENLDFLKAYRVDHPVAKVSCTKKTEYPAVGQERFRVTLIDYGAKKNILREPVQPGLPGDGGAVGYLRRGNSGGQSRRRDAFQRPGRSARTTPDACGSDRRSFG